MLTIFVDVVFVLFMFTLLGLFLDCYITVGEMISTILNGMTLDTQAVVVTMITFTYMKKMIVFIV